MKLYTVYSKGEKMAIKLRSTKDFVDNGIKVLVHGRPGVGKTTLCATAPKPIIISAESGLLSLRNYDIPAIEINTIDDLYEAYDFVIGEQGKEFKTVCLDSVSEIAERILSDEKDTYKDGRKAYGEMQDRMEKLLRAFRDIPNKNVYFSCKQEKIQTDTGSIMFGPSMPGKNLSQGIGYFFDEEFCLAIAQDENGPYRYLQTQTDMTTEAKDRSGALDMIEKPDLTHIFNKIKGVKDDSEGNA